MKRVLPKQKIEKESNISLNIGFNSNSLRIQKILIWLFFVIIMPTLNITAISAQTIDNIDNYIANADAEESQQLDKLANELNSTVYLSQGNIKTYGVGSPIVLETGSESFDLLYENNSLFNRIELIKIKLNSSSDMQETLNLEQLQNFYNLNYIYIIYTFDACGGQNEGCLTTQTQQFVQVSEEPVTILYKLSIPN